VKIKGDLRMKVPPLPSEEGTTQIFLKAFLLKSLLKAFLLKAHVKAIIWP